jgi:hypothetical protein
LRASESEAVIGHCDWLACNLHRSGDALLVVHDWDSITADSEAVLHASGQPVTSLSENEARERLRRAGTGSRRL